MDEYQFLQRVSSFEKGAWMLGVGFREAPGIDAVDLTNGVGISLKRVHGGLNAVGRNVEDAFSQLVRAGFYNVQLYLDARNFAASDVTGLTTIQNLLGARLSKVVVFAGNGTVTYTPTPEQARRAEAERRDAALQRAGHCSAEHSSCGTP